MSRFSKSVIESSWLAALVMVPLFFNIYSQRVFEEDKVPLLRSMSVLSVAFGLIWLFERRGHIRALSHRSLLKFPLILPWAMTIFVFLMTTFFSVAPGISFWGAYLRLQGAYTNLSYMIIFILIVLTVRSPSQVDRLITIVLMASVPAALYGVLQHMGLDPMPWMGSTERAVVTQRITSTAGNPIFIAAYLIMVIPLTLMRVLDYLGGLRQGQFWWSLRWLLGAGGYLLLLLIQSLAVLYSNSRGPFLGLLVGLFFYATVYSLRRRRTFLVAGIMTLAILVSAFMVVFNLPKNPLEPLGDSNIGRLGRMFDTAPGTTGRVRVLIWQGVLELLSSNPPRALIGYGPESLLLVIPRFCPPELGHMVQYAQLPDRSHNETFDALAMRGVLGFAVQIFLFVSFFYYVLKWLGLIENRKHRRVFLTLYLGGGAAGWFLPYSIQGTFVFSGVCLPVGMIVGMVIYLVWFSLTHPKAPPEKHPHGLLLMALFASVTGHFVEINLGIAIAATNLYLWVYIALAVVVGTDLVGNAEESGAVPQSPSKGVKANREPQSEQGMGHPSHQLIISDPSLASLSVMMGLLLSIMVIDFVMLKFQLNRSTIGIPWLFGLSFVLCGLIITSRRTSIGWKNGRWGNDWAVYTSIALCIGMSYFLIHLSWLVWSSPPAERITPQTLLTLADRRTNIIALFYTFCCILIGVNSYVLVLKKPLPERFSASWALGLALPLLAIVSGAVIVRTNLNASKAGIYFKMAQAEHSMKRWDTAIDLYKKAFDMQPNRDHYLSKLGQTYVEKAKSGLKEQDDLLQKALKYLSRAREINPFNVNNTTNLAILHFTWAKLSTNPAERKDHLALADDLYARALRDSPNNARLWNSWADLAKENGEAKKALERLKRSLELDPKYDITYEGLGSYYLERRKWKLARDMLEQALALNPRGISRWIKLGYAQFEMGDIASAIESNKKAVELEKDNFLANRNLSLLYEKKGNLQKALHYAMSALKVAPEKERESAKQLVKGLQKEIAEKRETF